MVPLLNTDFIVLNDFAFCICIQVRFTCAAFFPFGIIHVYHQGHKILITSTVIKRCKTKHKKKNSVGLNTFYSHDIRRQWKTRFQICDYR